MTYLGSVAASPPPESPFPTQWEGRGNVPSSRTGCGPPKCPSLGHRPSVQSPPGPDAAQDRPQQPAVQKGRASGKTLTQNTRRHSHTATQIQTHTYTHSHTETHPHAHTQRLGPRPGVCSLRRPPRPTPTSFPAGGDWAWPAYLFPRPWGQTHPWVSLAGGQGQHAHVPECPSAPVGLDRAVSGEGVTGHLGDDMACGA